MAQQPSPPPPPEDNDPLVWKLVKGATETVFSWLTDGFAMQPVPVPQPAQPAPRPAQPAPQPAQPAPHSQRSAPQISNPEPQSARPNPPPLPENCRAFLSYLATENEKLLIRKKRLLKLIKDKVAQETRARKARKGCMCQKCSQKSKKQRSGSCLKKRPRSTTCCAPAHSRKNRSNKLKSRDSNCFLPVRDAMGRFRYWRSKSCMPPRDPCTGRFMKRKKSSSCSSCECSDSNSDSDNKKSKPKKFKARPRNLSCFRLPERDEQGRSKRRQSKKDMPPKDPCNGKFMKRKKSCSSSDSESDTGKKRKNDTRRDKKKSKKACGKPR